MSATLKMVIFTSKDCPTCQHLKKNVLPVFKKANPDLEIEEVSIGLGAPSKNAAGEARADAYGVKGLPAIYWELVPAKKFPVGEAANCNLSGLNALYAKAKEALGNDD